MEDTSLSTFPPVERLRGRISSGSQWSDPYQVYDPMGA